MAITAPPPHPAPLVAKTPCPCCSPLSLSLSLPYFSSPAGTETLAELPLLPASGRRTLPSPPAAPGLAIAAMSSASSSSPSPPSESSREPRSRRRRPHLLRLGSPSSSTSASPSCLLRHHRAPTRAQGEQAHLPDPLALPLSLSFLLTVHAVVLRRGHGRRRISGDHLVQAPLPPDSPRRPLAIRAIARGQFLQFPTN